MTPCEERGWKVGDRFVVIRDVEGREEAYSYRDILELVEDDQSDYPLFINVTRKSKKEICCHIYKLEKVHKNEATNSDNVDHPSHYNQGDIECIDAIRSMLGDEGFIAYCRGNTMKYTWRMMHKGVASEDAAKAQWYLDRINDIL